MLPEDVLTSYIVSLNSFIGFLVLIYFDLGLVGNLDILKTKLDTDFYCAALAGLGFTKIYLALPSNAGIKSTTTPSYSQLC